MHRPGEADIRPSVPTHADHLTSDVLSQALGWSVSVVSVDRVGAEFGFSGESYRVDLAGAEVPAVVAKLWQLRDPDDVAELAFYRELAPQTPIRLPAFYGGDVDHDAARAWMVLEALDSFRQGDDLVPESFASVVRLIDTLARAQAAWWGRLDTATWMPAAPRFRRDADYLSSRRAEYLDRFGPLPDSMSQRLFEAIPNLVPTADACLEGAPATLLHLDLSMDNVLFLAPDDTPVLIDWARCGRGAGVHDLASLLFTVVSPDEIAPAIETYMACLADLRVSPTAVELTRRWLRGAMIHRFITQTCGIARWAADTPRGLEILDQLVAGTPATVAAWVDVDPTVLDEI